MQTRGRTSFILRRGYRALYKDAHPALRALTIGAIALLGRFLRIPLPWSPVPLTLQPFTVYIAGYTLPPLYSMLSQLIYACGTVHPFGANAGYIIGFILSAPLLSYIRRTREQSHANRFTTLLITHIFFIYIPGIIVLGWSQHLPLTSLNTYIHLCIQGVFPFIVGDVVKIMLAAQLINWLQGPQGGEHT